MMTAALPSVIQNNVTGSGGPSPDYRIQVQSACDVQGAVQSATGNNIRLSVITAGHDQQARSDAGSGLLVDLSMLRGVRVLESCAPTEQGAESLDHNAPPNTIVPKEDVQAAVRISPAAVGLGLNYTVANSSLFTVNGAAGKSLSIILYAITHTIAVTVAVGGGWARMVVMVPWLRSTHLELTSGLKQGPSLHTASSRLQTRCPT